MIKVIYAHGMLKGLTMFCYYSPALPNKLLAPPH